MMEWAVRCWSDDYSCHVVVVAVVARWATRLKVRTRPLPRMASGDCCRHRVSTIGHSCWSHHCSLTKSVAAAAAARSTTDLPV